MATRKNCKKFTKASRKNLRKNAHKKAGRNNQKFAVFGGVAVLLIVISVLIFTNLFGGKHAVTKLFNNVLNVGTYAEVDFDFAEKYNAEIYDNWNNESANGSANEDAGCTAVAVEIDGGIVIGRNMDLTVSDKPAYVFKTAVPGKYRTLNSIYTFRDFAPSTQDALAGLSDEFYKYLPFLSDDVLNEEGLYIELNMREGEGSKFSNSGTNPAASERVYLSSLPIYIGMNAANIDEALEYIKTLDIYSMNEYWNFAFLLADATGRYGVLEIAQNKIYWNEGENVQANFYVNAELSAQQEKKIGLGRYAYAKENAGTVASKADLLALMNDLRYSSVYQESPKFDIRSEFIGYQDGWTHDYLMSAAGTAELSEYISAVNLAYNGMTDEEKASYGFWNSALTEIVDINERTIWVRFFEDDERVYTLRF